MWHHKETQRIFLQWVDVRASYLAPGWPGRSGSACWANVQSSGQHQRHQPGSHTWDTPVLDSLNKKKKNSASLTNKPLYHSKPSHTRSKLTANRVEASSLSQIVLLENCCETCRWKDHYIEIWLHTSGTIPHPCFPLTWPYAVGRLSGNLIWTCIYCTSAIKDSEHKGP